MKQSNQIEVKEVSSYRMEIRRLIIWNFVKREAKTANAVVETKRQLPYSLPLAA